MAIESVVCRGYGTFGGGVDQLPTRGYGIGVLAPTPTPEPTPTPSPTSAIRAGAGHNILELGWYDDKPWIRARDRKVAKDMHDVAVGDDTERKRRQRQRAEAIAVAILMLR